MNELDEGQVTRSAAEVYEEFFVPALFGQWAPPTIAAAGLRPGQDVLDVACGTGILAREARAHVAPGGSVVGIDCNEGMLAVARRAAPEIDWRVGSAESLPFPDGRFDAVLCQFGLMFFGDPIAALREMWRVLRSEGRLAVSVWTGLETTPGYAAVVALLERLFGAEVAAALRAPFILGDPRALVARFERAGIPDPELRTLPGTARFPSIEAWVHTDVKGWTLADRIDEEQYQLLLREAQQELKRFCGADGGVAFPAPAHLVVATKP